MLKEISISGLNYLISSDGKVFGKHNIEIKQRLNADGYPVVTLGNKKIRRFSQRVHRLVCECFVENPFGKPEVNHIDGNKQNNNYTNLEWATRSEQMQHAFKLGLKTNKGICNGRAKLSELDIPEIKKLKNEGMEIASIARKFGVGWTTISHVLKGESWNK